MPRKGRNAKKRRYEPLSFKELANKLGLTPKQRVKIAKYMNKRSQGGEEQ